MMDKADFDKYLEDRYRDQIDWYDREAIKNQGRYRIFQKAVIVLSAITPVLIATGFDQARWPAVAISAIVAILTSMLKAFKYQENWIDYRTTCETLRKEIHFYRARADAYKEEDPESLFVQRVESLISRENTMWLLAHRQAGKEEAKK